MPCKCLLRKALRLILRENLFQFNKWDYLQTRGTAIGTKMVIAFDNIFLQEIEKQILNESAHKPLPYKCYIEDIISLWHSSRDVLKKLFEQANRVVTKTRNHPKPPKTTQNHPKLPKTTNKTTQNHPKPPTKPTKPTKTTQNQLQYTQIRPVCVIFA